LPATLIELYLRINKPNRINIAIEEPEIITAQKSSVGVTIFCIMIKLTKTKPIMPIKINAFVFCFSKRFCFFLGGKIPY